QADMIVTPTDLEAQSIARWGISPSRLLKLPMAIERAEVTGGVRGRLRKRLGIGLDSLLVGQLGALHPNKGTHDLVRAIERLNEHRTADKLVHLVLAGAPSPEFDAFQSQLPASTSRWLSILGPLPPADVPNFYAAIDLFSMPSRTDSFGIVFLEAWANAKPVVAAAAGGVPEVVQHEQTGLLVPFGDVVALAESIGGLLTDHEKARRLGEAGEALVRLGYTWNDRFATLRERIEEVVAAVRAQPPNSARTTRSVGPMSNKKWRIRSDALDPARVERHL
ncbi:MAG TPA: glycosyltransferase family 4 protein, partial [Isosphaeraceae bacterium]|nr:glycosyltransferase family 4 protein [Isosphaeraceae bacterium]